MIRTLPALFTLALMLPVMAASVADAHGPTRQKVTETVTLDAPVDKVWEVIGNFQDMSWHPAIAKTEGKGGNDAGATRVLTTGDGGLIKESLDKYDTEKRMIKYRIDEVDVKVVPVTNYSSWLSAAEEDGKTVVTWKGAFYRGFPNNDPPEDLNDAAAIKAVTGIYRAGLDALAKKFSAGG